MFDNFISLSFLSILLIPIFILFLTMIQSLGEDMRKAVIRGKKEAAHYTMKSGRETHSQRLRRIK